MVNTLNLDSKAQEKIKYKRLLWKRVRKSKDDSEARKQFNILRNQIRRLTRKAKKVKELNIAKNVKSNPKKFWQYAQSHQS